MGAVADLGGGRADLLGCGTLSVGVDGVVGAGDDAPARELLPARLDGWSARNALLSSLGCVHPMLWEPPSALMRLMSLTSPGSRAAVTLKGGVRSSVAWVTSIGMSMAGRSVRGSRTCRPGSSWQSCDNSARSPTRDSAEGCASRSLPEARKKRVGAGWAALGAVGIGRPGAGVARRRGLRGPCPSEGPPQITSSYPAHGRRQCPAARAGPGWRTPIPLRRCPAA